MVLEKRYFSFCDFLWGRGILVFERCFGRDCDMGIGNKERLESKFVFEVFSLKYCLLSFNFLEFEVCREVGVKKERCKVRESKN